MARILVGAFDPSARVAIDKPPVDLWLQVALTKLLGFGAFALLLPAARRNARRRRAPRPPAPPRARGGGSARAWLALGTVLFSAQGALGPRYLEAFDPAVGAWRRRRTRRRGAPCAVAPVTPAQLSRLAAAGQVRDALAGGGCRTAGCAGLERWIRAHGTDVSRGAGQPRAGVVYALAPVDETSTPPGSSSGTATSARSR